MRIKIQDFGKKPHLVAIPNFSFATTISLCLSNPGIWILDFLEALEDQLNLDIMLEKDLQDLLHLLLMNMLLTIALQKFVIRKKMYVFEKLYII